MGLGALFTSFFFLHDLQALFTSAEEVHCALADGTSPGIYTVTAANHGVDFFDPAAVSELFNELCHYVNEFFADVCQNPNLVHLFDPPLMKHFTVIQL